MSFPRDKIVKYLKKKKVSTERSPSSINWKVKELINFNKNFKRLPKETTYLVTFYHEQNMNIALQQEKELQHS